MIEGPSKSPRRAFFETRERLFVFYFPPVFK